MSTCVDPGARKAGARGAGRLRGLWLVAAFSAALGYGLPHAAWGAPTAERAAATGWALPGRPVTHALLGPSAASWGPGLGAVSGALLPDAPASARELARAEWGSPGEPRPLIQEPPPRSTFFIAGLRRSHSGRHGGHASHSTPVFARLAVRF